MQGKYIFERRGRKGFAEGAKKKIQNKYQKDLEIFTVVAKT
jgi:hypothetical protein